MHYSVSQRNANAACRRIGCCSMMQAERKRAFQRRMRCALYISFVRSRAFHPRSARTMPPSGRNRVSAFTFAGLYRLERLDRAEKCALRKRAARGPAILLTINIVRKACRARDKYSLPLSLSRSCFPISISFFALPRGCTRSRENKRSAAQISNEFCVFRAHALATLSRARAQEILNSR